MVLVILQIIKGGSNSNCSEASRLMSSSTVLIIYMDVKDLILRKIHSQLQQTLPVTNHQKGQLKEPPSFSHDGLVVLKRPPPPQKYLFDSIYNCELRNIKKEAEANDEESLIRFRTLAKKKVNQLQKQDHIVAEKRPYSFLKDLIPIELESKPFPKYYTVWIKTGNKPLKTVKQSANFYEHLDTLKHELESAIQLNQTLETSLSSIKYLPKTSQQKRDLVQRSLCMNQIIKVSGIRSFFEPAQFVAHRNFSQFYSQNIRLYFLSQRYRIQLQEAGNSLRKRIKADISSEINIMTEQLWTKVLPRNNQNWIKKSTTKELTMPPYEPKTIAQIEQMIRENQLQMDASLDDGQTETPQHNPLDRYRNKKYLRSQFAQRIEKRTPQPIFQITKYEPNKVPPKNQRLNKSIRPEPTGSSIQPSQKVKKRLQQLQLGVETPQISRPILDFMAKLKIDLPIKQQQKPQIKKKPVSAEEIERMSEKQQKVDASIKENILKMASKICKMRYQSAPQSTQSARIRIKYPFKIQNYIISHQMAYLQYQFGSIDIEGFQTQILIDTRTYRCNNVNLVVPKIINQKTEEQVLRVLYVLDQLYVVYQISETKTESQALEEKDVITLEVIAILLDRPVFWVANALSG